MLASAARIFMRRSRASGKRGRNDTDERETEAEATFRSFQHLSDACASIWIGKTRNEHMRALVGDYLQRLERFVRCEVVELRESASADRGDAEVGRPGICDTLTPGSVTVLLDPEGGGSGLTRAGRGDRALADRGTKEAAFLVGGHYWRLAE